MSKIKVAVVMGGYSNESVISLRSGQLILNHLNPEKYTFFAVHVLKNEWYALVDEQKYTINKADFSFDLHGHQIKFDVAVNTIHGTPGEDGQMQAYWNLIGLPYTGCDYYQSALTFNKRDTLSVLSKFVIKKAESIYLSQTENINFEDVVSKLGLPFMVKPNQSGSSLGVSKVKSIDDFEPALTSAFHEDTEILIESFLDGVEVSVGVIQINEITTVVGITEIVSETEFFDYAAKYEGKSKEITPARIDETATKKVEEVAQKVYNLLGMKGFSRAEYILVNGEPFFIEINTNPGLSPQSILPQQVAYAQLKMSDLFDSEIAFAMKRQLIWDNF